MSLLKLGCVAAQSIAPRRMLNATLKMAGAVRHVESYDLRSLWRRVAGTPDEPLPDVVILYHENDESLATLGRIRSMAELETLPVIIVTPETTARRVMQAMERDADDYLVTPVIPQNLAHRIWTVVARRRHPSPYERMLALGKGALREGNFEQAGHCFRKAADVKPDGAAALYYLGQVEELRGNLERAERFYGKAARNRMSLCAQEGLCRVYYALGRHQAMLPLVENLQRYVPVPTTWMAAAGIESVKLGQIDEATRWVHRAHKVWAASPDVSTYTPLVALGSLWEGFSRESRVRDLCVSIVLDFERNRQLIDRLAFKERMFLGRIGCQVGRWSEARRLLLKALDVAPDASTKANVQKMLAQLYRDAGVDRLAKQYEERMSNSGCV